MRSSRCSSAAALTALKAPLGGSNHAVRSIKRSLPRRDGSRIQLRPEHHNHVWSYDFVEAQTDNGRRLRLLTLIGEFTQVSKAA